LSALPAVPGVPALPAVPGLPGLPATPDVSSTVGSVTHTLAGATSHLPVAGDAVNHALAAAGEHTDTGIRSDAATSDLTSTSHTGDLVSNVETHAHDLTAGLDLHHGVEGALGDLHIGH
jgi:hypothetical protein